MNDDSHVTLRKVVYRGLVSYTLAWLENGEVKETPFEDEAAAIVAMAQIEERLRTAEMAGKGLTVNPFGDVTPFVNSKDVYFAAMRLRPRGLGFREAIEGYVAATTALQGSGVGLAEAAREYAEAYRMAKTHEVSLAQAIFEWAELKRQIGDTPLFEVLRVYLNSTTPPPEAAGGAVSSG